MGVHTCEATATDEGYVGIGVHRGARVASAGHGGQVLLSQATRELLDEGSDSLGLRDLGEHRLKDLTQPQRLYQLVADGLEGEFPALKTLENRPTNLPAQPTPLVGRLGELSEICELARRDDVRLVTLTGPWWRRQDPARAAGGGRAPRHVSRRRLLRSRWPRRPTPSSSCRRSRRRSASRTPGSRRWRRTWRRRSSCSSSTTWSRSSTPRHGSPSCAARARGSSSSPRAASRCASGPSASTPCRRSNCGTTRSSCSSSGRRRRGRTSS